MSVENTSLVGRKVRHRSGGPEMLAIGGCVDGNGKHIDDVMCEFWNGSKWDRKAFHPHFLEVMENVPPVNQARPDLQLGAIYPEIARMLEQNEKRSLIEEMSPKMDAAHAEYLKNHSSKGIMPMLAWEFAPAVEFLAMDEDETWFFYTEKPKFHESDGVWEAETGFFSYNGPEIHYTGDWKESLHQRTEPQQADVVKKAIKGDPDLNENLRAAFLARSLAAQGGIMQPQDVGVPSVTPQQAVDESDADHIVQCSDGKWHLVYGATPVVEKGTWYAGFSLDVRSDFMPYKGPPIAYEGDWKDSLHKRTAEPQQEEEEWVYLTSMEEIERHRGVWVEIEYGTWVRVFSWGSWENHGSHLLIPSKDGKPSCIRVRKKDYVGKAVFDEKALEKQIEFLKTQPSEGGAVAQKVWERKELLEHFRSFGCGFSCIFRHTADWWELGYEIPKWDERGWWNTPSNSLSIKANVNYNGTDKDSLVTLKGGAA